MSSGAIFATTRWTRVSAAQGAWARADLCATCYEPVACRIDGQTMCAFGEACSWPAESMVAKFRDEILAHMRPELAGKPKTELARRATAGAVHATRSAIIARSSRR